GSDDDALCRQGRCTSRQNCVKCPHNEKASFRFDFYNRRIVSISRELWQAEYPFGAPLNVAQVANLPYRRFPIGRASPVPWHWRRRSVCGLETRDTADLEICATARRAGCFSTSL